MPNKASGEVKALARIYGPGAIERLARIAGLVIGDDGQTIPGAESEATQTLAIRELLDRGYGKATQPISGDEDEAPVQVSMKVKFVRPK